MSDTRPGWLAEQLAGLTFSLSGEESAALVVERDRVVELLRGIEARTAVPDGPLLLVVAGGSGAGKSTTVNTLAAAHVSDVGVLRPTTRIARLVCHPDDRSWFAAQDGVVAELGLRIVASDALPAGVGLLDTPDIDTIEVANHRLAARALDVADGWIWLATARTYADEVGMQVLRRARARQALTAVVITQLRDEDRDEVLEDVDRLLAAEGIEPRLRLHIPYSPVVDGRLPPPTVAELRAWIAGLAPTGQRVQVRRQALDGLLHALPAELAPMHRAVVAEGRAAERLRGLVETHYAGLPDRLAAELEAGLSLRADVLDRWQQLVGGNEALLKVRSVLGQLGELVRDQLGRGGGTETRQVQVEVATELTRTVTRLLEDTAAGVRRDLERDPSGTQVLDQVPELRERPDRGPEVREMIGSWEAYVADRIETVGGPRKEQARRRSTALNAVATTAILVLFALSGGLTGGEIGIAAAASAASQWLLVRMLGERNVERLLTEIGEELARQVDLLGAVDLERVAGAISRLAPDDAAARALEAAVGSPR